MRGGLMLVVLATLLVVACGPGGERQRMQGGGSSTGAASAPAGDRPLQRVVIGVPSPSLSYLPAQLAWRMGYYREEGLDVEFVQVAGTSVVPAMLSGEADFTTTLSAVGAHAGQGGPSRIVQFHSVKLQHVLNVRPEITAIPQLSGKRVAVQSLGTLTAHEARKLVEHFGLTDVAIIAVGGDLERIAAMESGAADATIAAIPANFLAERRGFPSLLRVSTILEIPQAGFGTTEANLRDRADMVTRMLRGTARALPVIPTQRDVVVQHIAE